MFKNLSKIERNILIGILILSFVLIFFRLTRADLQGDDAHYSFRAIGYFDFMSSDYGQTTPIQWFKGYAPWWTKLSFHDHPPLVFIIQHLFFKIFGVNDFSAKLPFAIAGWCLIYIVFLIGKELFNNKAGLLAALFLALNSNHIWISRVGYLESIVIFFIALCLLFLIKGNKQSKYLIWMGVCLGLAMISKYTAFLLIPIIFIYALINYKNIFKNKNFWLGLILALIIFSPVIFYNIKVYQTRGHADVQFTALLNLPKTDWPILAQRSVLQREAYPTIFFYLFKNLGSYTSWPLLALFFISFFYLLVKLIFVPEFNKQKSYSFLFLVFIFLSFFFIITGLNNSFYITPLNFVTALFMGAALIDVYNQIRHKKILTYVAFCCLIIFSIYFLLFIYNTNHRFDLHESKFLFGANRLENLGFQSLTKFISDNLKGKYAGTISMNFTPLQRYNPNQETTGPWHGKEENRMIYIYDDSTQWFARLWYLERWRLYYFFPFIGTKELSKLTLNKDEIKNQDLVFKDGFYYLKSTQDIQLDKSNSSNNCAAALQDTLDNYPNTEVIELNNETGQAMFKVYKFYDLKPFLACEMFL
ncbi:MAG TPA: glycosyltransferase family 39 protein [bacterium]|nr:glycosyltransferase family 39 protein [bacterium]